MKIMGIKKQLSELNCFFKPSSGNWILSYTSFRKGPKWKQPKENEKRKTLSDIF
jgi:hypothetical protein